MKKMSRYLTYVEMLEEKKTRKKKGIPARIILYLNHKINKSTSVTFFVVMGPFVGSHICW